jgi:hypothetical protein
MTPMMEPKLKAIELVEKFEPYVEYQGDDCFTEREKMLINAKRCALIAVDEIINSINPFGMFLGKEYWKEVKSEIKKL